MKVFLIGGPTRKRGTPELDGELPVVTSACRALGQEFASRGTDSFSAARSMILPTTTRPLDAADGQNPTLEFHYPDVASVTDELRALLSVIPNADVKRMPCVPVGPAADTGNMQYSWLYSQLVCARLERGTIAIGGRIWSQSDCFFN